MNDRLLFHGLLALSLGSSFPGVASAVSWCQHDDPAYVETIRKEQGIGSREVGDKIACPRQPDAQDLPVELALPMPCGRRVVLRRIGFELDHVLDHVVANLGAVPEAGIADDANFAMFASINGPWTDSISGAFSKSGKRPFKRYYYIGKYEVTALQYDLFSRGLLRPGAAGEEPNDPACEDYQAMVESVRGTRALPATGLTWIDAVTFAHDYSDWLLQLDRERIKQNRRPYLPWEESAPGFLRLPTETEWEFAARGGLVDSSSRQRRSYDVVDKDGRKHEPGLTQIAYFRSPQNPPPRGSQVNYVGRLQPNLFGLYDMVGNVDEIVLDLFRPLRPDAFAGQRGGFVVRGGSAYESPSLIGVGYRREVPFFDARGPIRSESTGFRLLLSAPVFMNKRGHDFGDELQGNPELASSLAEARQRLLSGRDVPEAQEQVQAISELERLRKAQDAELARLRAAEEAARSRVDALTRKLDAAKEEQASRQALEDLLKTTRRELEEERSRPRLRKDEVVALNAELVGIQTKLESSVAELNERARRIRRDQYASAVLMHGNIRNLTIRIDAANELIDNLEEKASVTKERLTQLRLANKANFDYYVQTVFELSNTGTEAMGESRRAVSRWLEARHLAMFVPAEATVWDHIQEAASKQGAVPTGRLNQWLQEISGR
jgi:formylglycine-generating enzyme required for sulfatase activity